MKEILKILNDHFYPKFQISKGFKEYPIDSDPRTILQIVEYAVNNDLVDENIPYKVPKLNISLDGTPIDTPELEKTYFNSLYKNVKAKIRKLQFEDLDDLGYQFEIHLDQLKRFEIIQTDGYEHYKVKVTVNTSFKYPISLAISVRLVPPISE